MRVPRQLMIHRFDLYLSTIVKNIEGRGKPGYALKTEGVPCNLQPALSAIVEDYSRNDEIVSFSVFLIDKTEYDRISVEDRMVINSVNYEVVGKQNLMNLNRVFRVDVKESPE